ncbi:MULTISPECIES: DNA/RNA non-specific endonuclease [Pantoea]|jgi:endonuclease G|uniref:DNA/RNA non-specific endonuclease n=1 Tax=Pantoea TaxID=53335 RepID=UPI000EA10B32|nr:MULTISPECIES: DNA/RNA non-specific endonuclease [Pantoea]MBZ6388663.1 DNA/RNA non-specific endonuclease [Pantoea piersonii]MBZ6400514.1 DNA/RNA non-specific endonuclease [Pantoea piersonii]MBZ6408989.1 DNA/RNA non-specific endonuclease [Pantoea piersonii]MBZ6429259.1 DNA/RNA non-specific endonuclease [Pantoea piersonii]NYB00914.1 DNA/RNA non-specific endonuclease [Pantoea piersonii]
MNDKESAALISARLALTAQRRTQTRTALAAGEPAEPDRARAQRYAFQQHLRQGVITGESNDLLPIAFLEQGITCARAVALLREDGIPRGCGFMTHGGLFITNHHLLPQPPAQGRVTLQFGWRRTETGELVDGVTYVADAERFFLTSPTDELDCTLIALGEIVAGGGEAPQPLALNDRNDKHALGISLNLIHHPGGAPQQITLRNNALLARHEQLLHYAADTDSGSSGAPVFNDAWQLVALHHGGVESDDGWVNEGIRISAIIDWLKGELPQLPAAQQAQLMQALTVSENAAPPIASAAAPETNYGNRDGFQPGFLDGEAIDLAAIIAPRAAEVAPLRDGRQGAEAKLDYQHFSLLMSAERRLAFFTATNIDGARYISIDRGNGQPSLLEEGDRWYEDSRIDSRYTTGQAFYSEYSRWFDRGHLTRRSDPTWGTAEEAVRANKDTFHFTNCSPQHFRFNQSLQYWQGVERYILESGVLESKRKVSVLTGPVLNDQWRQYAEWQVPLMFWKVVLRINTAGKPQATALLVSQADLLDEPRRVLPHAQDAPRPNVDEYRVTVSALEKLTGLNFAAFRDWESWKPDESLLAQPLPAKLITTWEDLL